MLHPETKVFSRDFATSGLIGLVPLLTGVQWRDAKLDINATRIC